MAMRHIVTLAFCAALVTVGLLLPTFAAAKEKPVLAIATRSIEASVRIDDKLKAYPGLADNLLAEARREIDKQRVSADSDRKDNPDAFVGQRYRFERNYMQRSVVGRYVSIKRNDYLNTHGAHPNSEINTILWDATAGKRISIRPFFKETAPSGPTLSRLARAIRAKLADEKKARGGDEDIDPDTDTDLGNVQPDLLKMGAVALVSSTEPAKSAGLIFYFSPYAVGPYAEGFYSAFVSWRTLKDDLSPEGVALFGGERPKADDEKN